MPMRKLLICVFICLIWNSSIKAQVIPEDSLAKIIKDPRSSKEDKGQSALELGEIYFVKNRLAEALENFHLGLKFAVEINDISLKANCLNNIGIIYNRNGNLTKCISFIEECLKLRLQINDSSGLAQTYNNLGYFYQLKGDFKNAHGLISKAVQIQEKINDKRGLGYSLVNLSKTYYHNGDLDTAFICVSKSLKAREDVKDKRGIAESLTELAKIKLDKKEYAESEKFASKALLVAKEIEHVTSIRSAAEVLYKIYKQKNNISGALQMHELFVLMKDSLFSERNRKSSLQKEFQIAYDKKLAADSIKQQEADKVKDAQIKAQESELKQEKTMKVALYSGTILLLIFGAFMFNRYKIMKHQRNIIEEQKHLTETQNELLETKQKEILDSINYAKRIQYTLLANSEFLQNNLPQHFIFFHPKDIVSGDFYWAVKKEDRFYLAVCDSTGHGVPGAFMSLLSIGFLNEAITQQHIEEPNKIFDFVRQKLIDNISKEGQQDGFDGILFCIDTKKGKITYAAANNSPTLVRNNETVILGSDRMPVGIGQKKESFELFDIDIKKGDCIYLYTDGFADQFGGENGKKFKSKKLLEILRSLGGMPLEEQKTILLTTFANWKGSLEQVDDVCILGIRF